MALIFDRDVPAGIVDVARDVLNDLAALPDPWGGKSALARMIVSDTPLPVYSLRLDVLTQARGSGDAGLAQAKPKSWRVFVVDDHQEPVGVADVAPTVGASRPRFAGYARSQYVASSGQILTDAEGGGPLGSRQFQPAFLEIPGILVSALWFRSLDGQDDAVIVVEPVPRFLEHQSIYTLHEFLNLARARALQRLKFDNAPRGGHPFPPLA